MQLLGTSDVFFPSETKLQENVAVCEIVQHGDWAGILDCEKMPLLPAEKKRSAVNGLDVESVENKEHGRKILLTGDVPVYKDKRSKLEDTVKARQYV